MPSPDLPIHVPAAVRQGTEENWDVTMPGLEGFSSSHRGRGRKELNESERLPKGHMLGNEALDE